jgi:membrane protease YdiL (CAAX protease family)
MAEPTPPEEDTPPSDRGAIVTLAVLVEGGLILLAWGLGWLFDQLPLSRLRWDGMHALFGLAGAAPMLAAFAAMVRWPIGPLARIKEFTDQVIVPLMTPCTVLDLFMISLLAGLGEEMLFRGVLQDAFAGWLPTWAAVALAALLFGLLHGVTLAYAVLAAFMGAYLGWLYWVTGNLLSCAIAHGLYDFVVLVYLVRGREAPPEAP